MQSPLGGGERRGATPSSSLHRAGLFQTESDGRSEQPLVMHRVLGMWVGRRPGGVVLLRTLALIEFNQANSFRSHVGLCDQEIGFNVELLGQIAPGRTPHPL